MTTRRPDSGSVGMWTREQLGTNPRQQRDMTSGECQLRECCWLLRELAETLVNELMPAVL